jgi:hypothetical protein
MKRAWYYTKTGKDRKGPVSTEQLRQLAAAGDLAPGNMVFEVGTTRWVQAGSVADIFPKEQADKPAAPAAEKAEKPAAPAAAAPRVTTVVVCGVRRQAFHLVLRQGPAGGWWAESAHKRTGDREAVQPFDGTFQIDPAFAGCPWCGSRGAYRCGACGVLNCMGAVVALRPGHEITVCGNCRHPSVLGGA